MYRKIEDFQKVWKNEASETLKIFNDITDESLEHKATEDGRSLGFLAWHIVGTISEMFGSAGIAVDGVKLDDPVPNSVVEIATAFENSVKSLNEELPKHWKDEDLADEIPMYGETWTKGFTLTCFLMHAAHHRGQMTILMRQAGLKVHGVYGPAKEEWTEYGMPAPE